MLAEKSLILGLHWTKSGKKLALILAISILVINDAKKALKWGSYIYYWVLFYCIKIQALFNFCNEINTINVVYNN